MDFSAGTRTQFTYDLADRLVSQKEYTGTGQNGGTLRSSTDFTYADKTNYLTNVKHFSPLGTQNIGYTYGNINNGEMPDQVYSVSWNGVEKVKNEYDYLSRLSTRKVNGLATNYTYKDIGANQTTTLVESINTGGIAYSYDYDEVNNIKSVTVGNKKTAYEYDELNQLTRVNDPFENVTHVYTYKNGNIVYDLVYEYSVGTLPSYPQSATQYLYENATWSDVLTGVKKSHYEGSTEVVDNQGKNTENHPMCSLCEAYMKDYYNLFVELSLQQCTENDYVNKLKVKKHNAAYKKLNKLQAEMIKNIDGDTLCALLNHEDDRVKVNAASFCLNSEVLVEQSILTLEKIIAYSDDPTMCFSAKMLLKKFR